MFRLGPDAEGHEVVSALDAVPSLVAVHRVVAADDRGEILLMLEKSLGGFRRGVAGVENSVNITLTRAECERRLDQTVEMGLQRMHAAVRQQSREMNRAALLHGFDQDWI